MSILHIINESFENNAPKSKSATHKNVQSRVTSGLHICEDFNQPDVAGFIKEAKATISREDIDTYYSDVYVRVTPKSTELLKKYNLLNNPMLSKFRSNLDHDMWYELPLVNMNKYADAKDTGADEAHPKFFESAESDANSNSMEKIRRGLSAECKEIYNYIKTFFGLGPITKSTDALIVAVRRRIKEAVKKYIDDYGTIGDTISTYMSSDEFQELASLIAYDIKNDSFIECFKKRNKKVIKESVDEDIIQLLADNLGIDANDITNTYSDVYETSDGEEYLILTSFEAEAEAVESIKNTFNAVGIEAFAPDFRDWIFSNAVDTSWFDEALDEMTDNYIEDIKSESGGLFENRFIEEAYDNSILSDSDFEENEDGEMVLNDDVDLDNVQEEFRTFLTSNAGDPIQYYIDEFGETEFTRAITQNNLIDIDLVADECIKWDGVAHFVASYDGEEIELNNEYSAYRIN